MKHLIILYWSLRFKVRYFFASLQHNRLLKNLSERKQLANYWKVRYKQIVATSNYFKTIYSNGEYPSLTHVKANLNQKDQFILVLSDSTEIICSLNGKVLSISKPDHIQYS